MDLWSANWTGITALPPPEKDTTAWTEALNRGKSPSMRFLSPEPRGWPHKSPLADFIVIYARRKDWSWDPARVLRGKRR